MKFQLVNNIGFIATILLVPVILIIASCASSKTTTIKTEIQLPSLPPPPLNKKLVAVVGFENKSTYSADMLWDTSSQLLVSELLRANYFRVVEWRRMKDLFDRKALSTSSLVTIPSDRSRAKKILLCNYFIYGALTFYDASVDYEVSAISKSKTLKTTIRVDLTLCNADSGEYISCGTGKGTNIKVLKGGIAGGQSGTWDPSLADEALSKAISQAANELIRNYDKRKYGQ